MNRKTVFLTGATGAMGGATLRRLIDSQECEFQIAILARPSKKNRRKLSKYSGMRNIRIVWGDLTIYEDVAKGVEGADYVLHVGGMVPPVTEYHPEKTLKVNTLSMQNIVNAVKAQKNPDAVKVVYIGSVSQYGDRKPPMHWARTGDPIYVSKGDSYSLSKALAERILAESGLRHWVSLRQTGMLCKEILLKGTDPLTFHVPVDGVLEWTTVEESGELLGRLCEQNLPESFWRRFYNIGNGDSYRLSNLQFEDKILRHLSCPPPDKIFETNWFAARNFHGVWYTDSDALEAIIPFRSGLNCDKYMKNLSDSLPKIMKLAKIVPASLIKFFMRELAEKSPMGPLSWVKEDPEGWRVKASFGSIDNWEKTPDWDYFRHNQPSQEQIPLDHGFDSAKKDDEITVGDIESAARFRGGKCVDAGKFAESGMFAPLEWECCFGHCFKATPNLILRGGQWCSECLKACRYDDEARHNPFLAQAWRCGHPEFDEDGSEDVAKS